MRLTQIVALAAILLAAPLLGVAVSGRSVLPYLEFPPGDPVIGHAPFSWPVFWILALAVVAAVAPFVHRVVTSPIDRDEPVRVRGRWPWWGWLGLVTIALTWVLAWNRFAWLRDLQGYTFTPLWLGYILAVNGVSQMRLGRCLLVARTGYLLALFPVSALFWWFFEYLNRFAGNWHYVGAGAIGATEYLVHSTVAFSTVLPAVLSTRECLESMPAVSRGLSRWRRVHIRRPRAAAWATLLAAGAGLAGVGVWPDQLFWLLWTAPLLVLVALQTLLGGHASILQPVAVGDWRGLWQAALAALICGVFWELWNYRSLAHWQYAVPYVDRFHLFHMPMLGYAGYLPFGLECLAVSRLLGRCP